VTSEFPFLPEIGLGLTGFGIFFSFLGIIFFFDKGLIAMGNVGLLSWVIVVKILERLGLTGRSYYQPVLIMPFQILFLSGLGLTIGLKSTMQFFTKPKNYKGTISFGAGFFLVLIGWPFFGMLLEAYGFIVLFRLSNIFFHCLSLSNLQFSVILKSEKSYLCDDYLQKQFV